MKVLIYAQHLSGVGHRVRALELARALAERHEVALVDGGRHVPHRECADQIRWVEVPGLMRTKKGLVSTDGSGSLAGARKNRQQKLVEEVRQTVPDVLLIEHYPFSKWELASEIEATLDAAREMNPRVRVLCSLRDISPQTRHEGVHGEEYTARVLEALGDRFDGVLLHSDPAFTRLDEHFAGAERIPVAVHYTGFVSEKPRSRGSRHRPLEAPYAVSSVGGGSGSVDLALDCVEAWRRNLTAGRTGGRVLVTFAGLFWSKAEIRRVEEAIADGPFLLESFRDDFLDWLAGADFSISRAGYNTCTNLLETRRPAILAPHPRMSDQAYRATRLAELGLATTIPTDGVRVQTLAQAMVEASERTPTHHRIDLDGAYNTRVYLESTERNTD